MILNSIEILLALLVIYVIVPFVVVLSGFWIKKKIKDYAYILVSSLNSINFRLISN